MDKSETLEERLQKAREMYGSYDAIARVLRRCHPMFLSLSRVTVHRWFLKGNEVGPAARAKIVFALEILNSESVSKVESPYVGQLQQVRTRLGELRREVGEIIKDLNASSKRKGSR